MTMKKNLQLCLDIELNGVKEIYFREKEHYEQALFQFISQNIFDAEPTINLKAIE